MFERKIKMGQLCWTSFEKREKEGERELHYSIPLALNRRLELISYLAFATCAHIHLCVKAAHKRERERGGEDRPNQGEMRNFGMPHEDREWAISSAEDSVPEEQSRLARGSRTPFNVLHLFPSSRT